MRNNMVEEATPQSEGANESPFTAAPPPCASWVPAKRPSVRAMRNPPNRLKLLWRRTVTLPLKRFIDQVLLRRQWERFYLVFGGHIFFQTLRTAVKFDLFSLLAKHGRLTRREIADRLGIAEQPARILLLGCTSAGLLHKRGSRYSNSRLARRLLVQGRAGSICAYVELEHLAMYKAMPWMYDAVREYKNAGLKEFQGDEPTIYQRLARYPEIETVFQESMRELSTHANADLARFVDFSDVRHLVDVGGGNGTNVMEIIRHWPHLRGTVFESPSVGKIARENIEKSALADQVDVVAGDCFADPFPEDADCLLFAHFFTIWSEEKDRRILKKCFETLPRGGRVIIFNMMQSNDERGPLTAAIGSPYFLTLATGEGMLYTWDEYASWMRDAGFARVKMKALSLDHGVVIGIKE